MPSIPELRTPPQGGFLEVGIDPRRGEVVVNLDRDRTGHITFTPDQARQLAALLVKKADETEELVRGQAIVIL